MSVVHIAGVDVRVGGFLRQRCGWCGALLIDYDLANVAVPVGTDPWPAVWPVGSLVSRDGSASWTMEHVDGDPLPDGSCGRLDPAATR